MKTSRVALGLVALAIAHLGCGKTDKNGAPAKTGDAGATGATAGATGSSGSSTVGGAGGSVDTLVCATPHPGPSPLTRLGNDELNRSWRALVPEAAQANLPWLPEGDVYVNDPMTQLDGRSLEQAHELAHDIAQLLVDDTSRSAWLLGCDVDAEGEDACRDALTDSLLERAYRREVTAEDRDDMAQVFADGKALGGDFKSGMRAIAEVALLSPDFTYLIEQGSENELGNAVELTSYETAARLSYFLTGSPPDAELFAAAKRGELDAQGLAAQTKRLLGSPENRESVSRTYLQRLGFDYVPDNLDLGFTSDLSKATIEASRRFVQDVTFDGAGTFGALLTEPSTWANGPLAAFYGYPKITGTAFQKVPLDPTRAAGLFTQAAFLVGNSHGPYTSPVHRGLKILRSVLCYDVPPPPANVDVSLPDPVEGGTMRERLESATRPPQCNDCHRDINPLGFAFEHYDAVGKWRDVEDGRPIDASGEVRRTDAQGPFRDAVELMHNISESDDAKACFVTYWLGHAYRRPEAPEDACTKTELTDAFSASDGNIVELLATLAQTDNFRYRLKSELKP